MDHRMALNTTTLRITPEILSMVAEIDEFQGAWRAIARIAPELRLSERRERRAAPETLEIPPDNSKTGERGSHR